MDVPDFEPREPHHILFKKSGLDYVMDDESWKPKRNRQELMREGWLSQSAHDILDHLHWFTYCSLWHYNLGGGLPPRSMLTPAKIFEDKCIYCEAAEHEIPFQKIQDVGSRSLFVDHNQEEWIKGLECLWHEYCDVDVKPAKQ